MSATELDLPLLPSAEQIRRREFASIRRGYDPEQVRDYLRQVAAQVETLEHQLRESRMEIESSHAPTVVPEPDPQDAPEVDPYDELAGRLAELIRAADGQAEKLVEDARVQAARRLSEARADADRIRTDAQSRAEEARQQGDEVLEHARLEAERVLSSLSTRRENLVDQLQQMQSRLLGVAQELESALGQETEGDAGSPAPPSTRGADDPGLLDPHYEDLWMSSETAAMNVADIPAGIDFDDEDGPSPASGTSADQDPPVDRS